MSIKLFSDFLIEHDKLTKEQFQEVLLYQSQNSISLSKIALDEGFLSLDDLKIINEKQKTYDQKFARTVLDLMLLNTSELEQLLKKYEQKHISFYDALIKKNLISKDELDLELKSFEADQKKHSKHVFKELAFFDRDNLIQESISVLEKLFERTTSGEMIKLKKIDFSIDSCPKKTVVAQGLRGEEDVEFAMVVEEKANVAIANLVLKEPLLDEEENEVDTIGKFLNVFLVNIAVSLISKDISVELGDADIHTTNKFDLDGFYRLDFICGEGELTFYIKI